MQAPQPINAGTDNCYFCKMTISDVRFGAEIVTTKGKIFKFDDVHCMLSYLKTKDVQPGNIKDHYLANYSGSHQLINVNKSFLLQADELRSPMGGNIAAFDNSDSLKIIEQRFSGKAVNWSDLIKP